MQACVGAPDPQQHAFVTYQDRKQVAADLKPVYRAVNADATETALRAFDQKWGQK